MNSDRIKEIFKEYLEKEDTNYAIFIDAKWGHGKTFYWKTVLEPFAKEKGFSTVRISLFGVTNSRELDKRMRHAILLPSINSMANSTNKLASLTHAIGEGLKQFTESKLSINIDQIVSEISINAYINDKIVICFDDFERTTMPKEDVLGFLNNLIEDKSVKMVILCNSEELYKSEKEEYNKAKEKVVRWTFKLEQNTEKIFEKLCSSEAICKKQSFKEFLDKQMPFIKKIIGCLSDGNLRILKRYLDVLDRIFPIVYSEKNNAILEEILYYSFASTNEACIGVLTKDNLEDFENLREIANREDTYDILIHGSDNGDKKYEKSAVKEWRKYLEFRDLNYVPYPSLSEYLLTGFLDEHKLEEEIRSRSESIDKEWDILIRKLMTADFRYLSDSDFKDGSKKIIDYIRDGKYDVEAFPAIAYWLNVYIKNGFIKCQETELEEIIDKGLTIASNRYKPNRHNYDYILNSYNDDSSELLKFTKAKITEIYNNRIKELSKKDLERVYDLIGMEEDFRLNIGEAIDILKKTPDLIKELDIKKLVTILVESPNSNIFTFNAYLGILIDHIKMSEYLLPFLKSLKKKLKKIKPNDGRPIANYNIKELLKEIDKAIGKLVNIH